MLFDQYVEEIKNKDIPFIGYLVWYNVPGEATIDYQLFNSLREKYDAPVREMGAPKMHDVFKRATTSTKITKVPVTEGVVKDYTWKDASYDSASIYRNVIEEVKDKENHTLDFREVAQGIYSRSNENFVVIPTVDSSDGAISYIDSMTDMVNQYMDAHRNLMPAIQSRTAAQNALESTLRGIRVRPSGGVYFVSSDLDEKVQGLYSMYNELPNCSCHIVPLIDDKAQRDMLRESFEAESVGEAQELIDEINELVKSGKVSSRKFLAIQKEYKERITKLKEYQTLIGDSLQMSEDTLKIVKIKIKDLVNVTESGPEDF